MNRMNTNKVFN